MLTKIQEKIRLIKKANIAYWQLKQSIMSDEAYDKEVEELRNLTEEYPNKSEIQDALDLLDDLGEEVPDAPVADLDWSDPKNVGAPVKHDPPMLSLSKGYTEDSIGKWADKLGTIVATPKLDGMAMKLVYENGTLLLAATRGKGTVGENVTMAAQQIESVPQKIPVTRKLELRGEAFIPNSSFNKHLKDKFANPRNAVAGTIKRKEFNDDAKEVLKHVVFIVYDVIDPKNDSYLQNMKVLKSLGFRVPAIAPSLKEGIELYDKLNKKRDEIDAPLDGVVFRLDSVNAYKDLGSTSHHPKGAIAYKFIAEVKTTKLLNIEWSLGRTGKLTPVGLVEPVELSGATVSRVTLHNVGYIEKEKLTLNSTIEMKRSGEVIPKIERQVIAGDIQIEIPDKCPICLSPTERESDFLYCTGPKCAAPKIIEHFCKATNIEGFGGKVVETLFLEGVVSSIADLYTMDRDRMAQALNSEKTADNLLAEISKAKTLPLSSFVTGLGVPLLGRSLGRKVEGLFSQAKPSDLVKIPELIKGMEGIGDTTLQQIDEGLQKLVPMLTALDSIVTLVIEKKTGALSGQSFVFTGALQKMTRSEAQKLVQSLGADTPSSVSKGLTYLVVGEEKDGKSSKQVKAEKLGVKILTEDEFLKMIES